MTIEQRIIDIESTNLFTNDEVVYIEESNQSFESWEFSVIMHYTNEELYYLDDELVNALQNADTIEDTDKGIIYCFT